MHHLVKFASKYPYFHEIWKTLVPKYPQRDHRAAKYANKGNITKLVHTQNIDVVQMVVIVTVLA